MKSDAELSVSRRAALIAAGAVVATGLLRPAHAGEKDHAGHDMAEMGKAAAKAATGHQSVVDAALDCVKRGEACIPHCIDLMSQGDTSLKGCLQSVSAMMPMCAALARFAALDSPRLKELAKLCADVCEDCEKECKKHAEHHAVCNACAESCAACAKECKTLVDA
jgi:Cys-rich four helix bundle protein (predicted Tat secretion target)